MKPEGISSIIQAHDLAIYPRKNEARPRFFYLPDGYAWSGRELDMQHNKLAPSTDLKPKVAGLPQMIVDEKGVLWIGDACAIDPANGVTVLKAEPTEDAGG
ncbi:MAG: hypothetical protein IPK60_00515 [Sandaracinaceae bacterium]|jgi:hypothetical protein|nr:hypothetical protein [Sandaracinaceae bacterium]